jgi:hypothetical protein
VTGALLAVLEEPPAAGDAASFPVPEQADSIPTRTTETVDMPNHFLALAFMLNSPL